jgi:hypothetical protein
MSVNYIFQLIFLAAHQHMHVWLSCCFDLFLLTIFCSLQIEREVPVSDPSPQQSTAPLSFLFNSPLLNSFQQLAPDTPARSSIPTNRSSSAFATPPRRARWLDASSSTPDSSARQKPPRTTLSDKSPAKPRQAPTAQAVASTVRAPLSFADPRDTNSRERIMTMAKIQAQLESALEEERSKRMTRDVQVHVLLAFAW